MNITVSFAFIALLLATLNPTQRQPTRKDGSQADSRRHTWQLIDFPTLPNPGQNLPTPHASLHNDGKKGLRVQLHSHIFAVEKTPKSPLEYESIHVRLTCATGESVEPLPAEGFRFAGITSGLGTPYYHTWHFPWSTNCG